MFVAGVSNLLTGSANEDRFLLRRTTKKSAGEFEDDIPF
jgi:hypothetical protein